MRHYSGGLEANGLSAGPSAVIYNSENGAHINSAPI